MPTEWRGTLRNGMERDPVIAVIVGSRDPATHLNYLYLFLSLALIPDPHP